MAIRVPQGYVVTSKEAIDNRLVLTKKQMREINDGWMPEAYLTLCPIAESGMTNPDGENLYKIYIYNRDYEWNDETGRFRAYAGDYNDLANIPFINGVPVQGSEGDGLTYKLQNKLYAITSEGKLDRNYISVGPGIEIDNATWDSEHLSGIKVRFDGDTIKSDSESNLYIDLSALFTEGDAIEIDLPEGSRKATLNVLFDDETIHLDNSELNIHFDSERAVGLDDGEFYVKIDEKTIKYDSEGRLYALPEPLKDGIATSIRHKTKLWDSEFIDLVYDSEKGLAVDPTNHLFIKLNGEKALKFDNDGNIMVKVDGSTVHIDSERGLELHLRTNEGFDVDSEGYLFIKIDDNSIHYNPITGNLEVRPAENFGLSITSEGAIGGPGNLYVKIDGKTIHYDDDQGWGEGYLEIRYDSERAIDVNNGTFYIKVDKKTVFFNSEGEIKINPDPRRSFHVSEGLLYVDVDGDTVRHKGGKLEAKKVLAGKAIRLNDSAGGDVVVNVVVDDNTIHIDSEGGQTKLALHLSTSEGIGVHYGKLYTEIDNATIVYNNNGQLKLPLDYTTIILNSEGKIHNNIDNNTLIYSTSERVVRVEVPHLVLLGNNADFDSERYWRIRHDSELEARADNIEDHLFFLDPQGNIITVTSSELSYPGVIDWQTYHDRLERLQILDNYHYTYSEGGKKVYIPANWPNYDQVYGVSNTDAVIKPKMAHVSKVDRDKWNRVVGKQNKLILEDTTNNTNYKNALLLYANGSHDTPLACATSEISLRVDNSSICIREPSEGGYLELYADGYIHRPPHTADLVVVTDSEGQPYWTSSNRFGKVDGLAVREGTNTYNLKLNNKILQLYLGDGLDYSTSESSEGKLFVDIYEVLPPVAGKSLKALTVASDGTLVWGEAGKIDLIDVTDGTTTRTLRLVNKKVTIPVTDGLMIKPGTSEIAHINEVAPQTRVANHILIPVGTDRQGHIIDGTAASVANGLRELTFYDRTNNAGAYVNTGAPWGIIADPTNVTNTTNVSLKIAGFDGTAAANHKYDNATLKVDANGISGNYQIVPQKTGKKTTSEGLLEINGNKVNLLPSFLNRLVLNDYAKNAIDSEGLRDDHYYPTITLLKTELDAKQDVLHPILPAVITSEGDSEGPNKLYVLYDNDSIKLNNNGELVTKDVYLATLPGIPLSDIVPTDANSENPMTTEGWVQDSISSNLGRFVGNFTSEGALPGKGEVPTLARNDYAFVTIPVYDSEGNVEYLYYRYKYVDDTSEIGHWQFEYQVSGSTFTYKQLLALNSDWNLQLTNTAKAHFNNADIHITAAERTKWNNKQDKLTAGDHINATSLAANTIKVDAQSSIVDAATYNTKLATIGAIKGYFKKKQTAIAANTGTIDTSANYVIASIAQNEQGVITPTRVAFDYDKLSSRPTINGSTITGTMYGNQFVLAGTGLAYDTDNKTLKHSNSVTANTTSGLKYFTYDAQGHVTAATNKTLGRGINDQSNVIGHSNSVTAETTGKGGFGANVLNVPSAIKYDEYGHVSNTVGTVALSGTAGIQVTSTAGATTGTVGHTNSVTAATNVGQTANKIPYFSYDAQGHITASNTKDQYPSFAGNAGKVLAVNSTNNGVYWLTLPEGTSYVAGTGLSLTGTTFNHSNSVAANTTSGLKYFTYDAQGHVTAGVNKTLGRGISDSSNVIGHSNSVTANTTSGLKYFTYDAQGHVTAGVNKTLGRGISDSSNIIGHSNTAITASTTQSLRAFAVDAYGHTTAYTAKTLGRGIDDQSNVIGHSNTAITAQTTAIGGWNTTAAVNGGFYLAKGIKHDTYGHLTAQVTADTVVTGDRGIRVNSSTKKIEHTNDVLNGAKTDYSKTGIKVPYFSYDAYGHLTATGEKDIFPALAGNAGKVLKVNSSSNGLEWGVGGGGGGGGNYNFTGKNGITVTTDSENVTIAGYTAGDNIIINGSLISATAGAPPFVNITGDAKSNSNLNAYLTALENKDTELDSKKQNKLVAGAGITLTNSGDTTTISSSYGASDSIGIVNNKFEVTSPINGGNHVIVEGDWDATGHTISVPAVTTFTTGDRTKLPEWGLILDNFKKIQAAVNDPTASTTTSTTFIDTISQDTQGKITVTKKTLPPYPTVGNGSLVIQLNGVDKGRFTANQSTSTVVNLQPAWDDISGKPATSTPLNGKLTLSDVVVPSRSKEFTANQGTNVTLELHGTDVYLERW